MVSGILVKRWQPYFMGELCWPDRLSSCVRSRIGESAQTAQARESTDAVHLNPFVTREAAQSWESGNRAVFARCETPALPALFL